MAIDFDGLVNAVVTDPTIFGKTVTYTPQNGTQFDINVVFDEAWRTVDFSVGRRGLGAPVSTTKPCFGCRLADFPSGVTPQQGDACTINGADYAVSDAQPDGISDWFLISLS